MQRSNPYPSMVEFAKGLVAGCLRAGDAAVDATAGKGNDTLFLSQRVGEAGQVFAFDIDADAIECTRARLQKAGADNVQLIHDSHANLRRWVRRPIGAAMFNLGYLPGYARRERCTQAESTCQAIQAAIDRLRPGGVLTVCAYVGHPQGQREQQAVQALLQALSPAEFQVLTLAATNQRQAPVLYAVYPKATAKKLG